MRPDSDDARGLPLAHFLDHEPSTDVGLHCLSCGSREILPMADVVTRLRARGRVPRRIGICELAGLVTRPCRCGAWAWMTRPERPIGPGMGRRLD